MNHKSVISLFIIAGTLIALAGNLAAPNQALPAVAKAANEQPKPVPTTLTPSLNISRANQGQLPNVNQIGGCGWDKEWGTQAQADCETILRQLNVTYSIHWEAPTDPAIKLYDFKNHGLRRWLLADAQALKAALDGWSKALGGVEAAKRELGLATLTFKLRGKNFMLLPGDLGEYIDEWNEIDLGSLSIQAVDFAHELAHRWERHHANDIYGQAPAFRTLQFILKFYKGHDAQADTWTPDGGGWTDIARGTEGHYHGARPEEDFAETASHLVMQTAIAQQYKNSARYQFMVALMPGLQ